MFIAVAGLPKPTAMQQAAALCGLAMMEVRSRCAGVLPRVLVRQAPEAEARRLAAGLEALGFRTFAAEVRQIPSDAQRIVARQLEWTDAGFTVTDGRGTRHDCPSATLALLQPGFRTAVPAEVVKTTERKFSLGRALATGGLSISKKVEKVTEQVSTSRESYILVVRTGGLPGIMLYESRLSFQCLGAESSPPAPQPQGRPGAPARPGAGAGGRPHRPAGLPERPAPARGGRDRPGAVPGPGGPEPLRQGSGPDPWLLNVRPSSSVGLTGHLTWIFSADGTLDRPPVAEVQEQGVGRVGPGHGHPPKQGREGVEPRPEPLEARQELLRRHAPGREGHPRLAVEPGPVLAPEAAVPLHVLVDGRSGEGRQDACGHPVDAEGFARFEGLCEDLLGVAVQPEDHPGLDANALPVHGCDRRPVLRNPVARLARCGEARIREGLQAHEEVDAARLPREAEKFLVLAAVDGGLGRPPPPEALEGRHQPDGIGPVWGDDTMWSASATTTPVHG